MTGQTVTPPRDDAALLAFHAIGVLFVLAILCAIGWLIVNSRRPTATSPHIPADVDLAQCLATTKAIDADGAR